MSGIDKYAVFGNPIKHSKSPAIHRCFRAAVVAAMQYRAVRVELDGFDAGRRRFFEGGGAGLNVHVPFKREAFAFADRLSARAARAGAVNTLTRAEDGASKGITPMV